MFAKALIFLIDATKVRTYPSIVDNLDYVIRVSH